MANRAAWAVLASGHYDDGLTSLLYDIDVGTSPGHIQYNGIGRVGVRFDTGSAGLGSTVKSIWVRFRKYGNPTGNITVGVRKQQTIRLLH